MLWLPMHLLVFGSRSEFAACPISVNASCLLLAKEPLSKTNNPPGAKPSTASCAAADLGLCWLVLSSCFYKADVQA